MYRIKVTERTNEIAEELGVNIAGYEFLTGLAYIDTSDMKCEIRGYVKMPEYKGIANINVGPITLTMDDLKKV